jgi:hypothetical protein
LERRVQSDPQLLGLSVLAVTRDLVQAVSRKPAEPKQVVESRPQYLEYGWYYKVKLDYDFLPRPVFVEIILTDDDEEVPTATIVSVHLDSP